MQPRFRRQALKPNWWTIFPLVASLLLWGGIMYVGAVTGSAISDRSERIAAISTPAEASAVRH